MKKRTLSIASALILFGAASTLVASQRLADLVPKLQLDHQPLADAFNAAEDKARLVVVLSPT